MHHIPLKYCAAAFWVAVLFFSCGDDIQMENKQVFRYNEAQNISSLDPAFASNLENIWATNQVFDGLVRMGDDLTPQPSIAERWEISPNGKTYTFFLRNDVFFHKDACFADSTRRVEAQDFVYSFERLVSKELASPGSWVLEKVDRSKQGGFRALDKETLEVYLKDPFAPFLGILAMQYCSVVPQEAVEAYGADFRSHPIGTGPFQFAFWMENVALVLHASDNYWEKDEAGNALPYLDAIKVDFVKDKGTAFLDFTKGKYDFMSGIHQSYKDELLTISGDLAPSFKEKIAFQKAPFLFTEYMGFLVDDSLPIVQQSALGNKQVRQALNYALDRKEMARYLRNNTSYPANKGFIPSGLPAYSEDADYGYAFDLQKAEKLLTEAGFKGGKGIEKIGIATTSDYVDLCEYVQHAWGKLGVEVGIDIFPSSSHRSLVAKSEVLVFRKSWLADYPDSENFLSCFLQARKSPAGPNYTHFGSSAFDSLYHLSQLPLENEKRMALYRQMDSLAMDEAAIAPMFYGQVSHFMRPEVKGLVTNSLNLIDLRKVRIAAE